MKKLSRITNKSPLILDALFLTITVGLYAPFSIYVANREDFWFNLRTFWYVPMMVFILGFIFLIGIGFILKNQLYYIYLAFVFGLAICFYLQGNFLGLKVGILNGAQIDWDSYRLRMIVNLIIWVVILVIVSILFLWKSKVMSKVTTFLSASFCFMQLFSLTMLLIPIFMNAEFESPTSPVLTSKGLYEVGEENIIVFILDGYDASLFKLVQHEEPELIHEFDGFVFYDNYSGLYPTTLYSITSLMGGRTFRNELPRSEWVEENAKKPLYFDELYRNGYEVSLYTDMLRTIPKRVLENATNYTNASMRFYNIRTCFAVIYRLVACQYFPDFVKQYAWMDDTLIRSTGTLDIGEQLWDYDNASFKYGLDKSGITVNPSKKEYKYIHLWGGHEPYHIDEMGNESREHYDRSIVAKGCLRIMADYLRKLKEKGIYDNSAIIITADHGYVGDLGLLCNPVFLFKDKQSKGTLKSNHYEASQENFGATIADLSGSVDFAQYGDSICRADENTSFERFFYQYIYCEGDFNPPEKNENYYLVEYRLPRETNNPSMFMLTNVEYLPSGETISHKQYCESCQISDGKATQYYGWDEVYQLKHVHRSNFPFNK